MAVDRPFDPDDAGLAICKGVLKRIRHELVDDHRKSDRAIRHGGADSVRIRLTRTQDGRQLVVEDDGKGFDADVVSGDGGYGLVSMRDRATGLPGSFEIRSAPGQGTTVAVTW